MSTLLPYVAGGKKNKQNISEEIHFFQELKKK